MIKGIPLDESLPNLSTPGDILKFALKQEKEACRFYGKLLDDSTAEVLRDLIAQLKDEELRHVRLIERKIADLNSGRLT